MRLINISAFCLIVCIAIALPANNTHGQTTYFPPLEGDTWETTDPESLGWCTEYIDTLYNFLEAENTKAFIVLKDGKIVLEKYFGTFVQDSLWYWASAAKTLTAFLVGKANENGDLDIGASTSTYLGTGWTSCTADQENNITLLHQLTMTSGLDDGVADNHCTLDTCLQFLAGAGSRWAYHNAPYTLLHNVLENATGTEINLYTHNQLKSITGMNGFWIISGYDHIYLSNARSMARFGLLIQNNGNWNGTMVMSDSIFFNAMVNTSQLLNKSYGYLWWLNGKESYMLPGTQIVFPGPLAPDAPSDMIAALGKNGQILSIANDLGLVIVRLGNTPDPFGEVSVTLCNAIWEQLGAIMCTTDIGQGENAMSAVSVFPNPVAVSGIVSAPGSLFHYRIFNAQGQLVFSENTAFDASEFSVATFPPGVYLVQILLHETAIVLPLIVSK